MPYEPLSQRVSFLNVPLWNRDGVKCMDVLLIYNSHLACLDLRIKNSFLSFAHKQFHTFCHILVQTFCGNVNFTMSGLSIQGLKALGTYVFNLLSTSNVLCPVQWKPLR